MEQSIAKSRSRSTDKRGKLEIKTKLIAVPPFRASFPLKASNPLKSSSMPQSLVTFSTLVAVKLYRSAIAVICGNVAKNG